MSITIDKEFESLIPPLTAEEFAQLEANCMENGILDSLKTWNGILVDGHNRFKIAAKHGLRWSEKQMQFADRDAVKIWIIDKQLGQRNLIPYDKTVLELKKKEILSKQAKEISLSNLKSIPTDRQKSDARGRVDEQIGKLAGVSRDTVRKVEAIEKNGDKKLIEEIRNGDISINKGYQIAKGIEIKTKSPAKMKQEYLDGAKKEHKDFQEQKVVSMAQIQLDKANRQIIASDLYVRLLNIGKRIEEVYMEMEQGDIDIKEMSKTLSPEKVKTLTGMFRTWNNMLTKLDKEVRNN